VAAVVAPDGVARVGVLDDARASGPSIGIDATGATTAAWVRMTDTTEVRTARATGGAWEPPRALGVRPYLDDQAPDVAVSPAGRVLLAWAEQVGIRASLDGSAPQTLAAEPHTVAPAAAVNDAGAAVVAYMADGLRASSRAADGPWASLSVLSAEGAYPEVVVAPDGRAVIGWRESAADGTGAFATWGHAGGAWAPPIRLSSPTRPAETPQMWIGADGAPRLVWVEDLSDPRHTRLRGARLTPDAEAGPPDTVAPVLATRLPHRTPRTRTARLRIGIPVHCSEACDVRVRLLHGVDKVLASVTRAVTANRRVILPLRIRADIALLLLTDRTARRPRLEVLASDRVGNLARASGRLRIRIDDPPRSTSSSARATTSPCSPPSETAPSGGSSTRSSPGWRRVRSIRGARSGAGFSAAPTPSRRPATTRSGTPRCLTRSSTPCTCPQGARASRSDRCSRSDRPPPRARATRPRSCRSSRPGPPQPGDRPEARRA
jgi:hypothetical protein